VKIKIRKATANDIENVVQLEGDVSLSDHKKHQYKAELSNTLSHFYVAIDSETDEIIGYTIFWIIDNLMEIHHITVKATIRRSGIGRSLMKVIKQKAKQETVDQIYLEVRKSNHSALAFYKTFGFKECGYRKAYYKNPVEDALLLKKSI
jgi:ribosomal-protein-alanine acetyltransferase